MDKPTIGRIVHFVPDGGARPEQHYPAIITHVWTDLCVNLEVFRKGTAMDSVEAGVRTSVMYADADNQSTMYSWHWPERS
jgi:hypothetical protein